ncbi:ribbon-helix-helix domain-containing protein [Microbacterium sp. SLBN-146]|uniref:ribbon-helix-helix domain-containing protein n=1 Tax=Microbacterium sp. SLBN-146 TaxID=2768457 RepID=UPI00116ADD3B|nr:ribbon-helix-helix domain-containing protein [Microbacterium sp. SLBN-146]TQJ30291.1 ribbon-helix-helix CopG family protein [Microbacterium sp. SLBN-146]
MAMTLRIPEELDRQLEEIAAAEHVSKHTLLLQAAQQIVDRRERRAQIAGAVDFVLSHDAVLLERLADA